MSIDKDMLADLRRSVAKYTECPECHLLLGKPGAQHKCDRSKTIARLTDEARGWREAFEAAHRALKNVERERDAERYRVDMMSPVVEAILASEEAEEALENCEATINSAQWGALNRAANLAQNRLADAVAAYRALDAGSKETDR